MAANNATRQRLERAISDWVEFEQQDDSLQMWITDSLIERMTLAAWAVLTESRQTQEWMKKEGHTK